MPDFNCDNDLRWLAVATRDASADGEFYICVRTTKVYCRPSCPGRPLRKNVFFVVTKAEAARAGMRPCKRCRPDQVVARSLDVRIAEIDWERVTANLDRDGFALLGQILTEEEADALRESYFAESGFRSKVVMARHGFGAGEYKYFADPLPPIVTGLRALLYRRLAPIAGDWRRRLRSGDGFPDELDGYLAVCVAAGQAKPTPLLLSYGSGDYNRLHRDLYGPEIFPIQVAVLLSEPGKDFEGGEFILTEQRPRAQSRAHVPPLQKGDAVAFAVNERPVDGARGPVRAVMRHGVSTIRSGNRMALGLIFHGAA